MTILKGSGESPDTARKWPEYEYRNALDPKDSRIPQMNEALRAIGCFTSSSERTDQ